MSGSARKVFSLSLDRGVVARVDELLAGASRSRLVEDLLNGWAVEKALGVGVASEPRQGKGSFHHADAPLPASSRPSTDPIPVVDGEGRRLRVSISEAPRPWRQHLPTCRCAVCRPPKSAA